MRRELIKRIIATFMLIIVVAMPVAGVATAAGTGTPEARFVIDWNNVKLTEGGTIVPYFAVLKGDGGYYFYIMSNKEYDDVSMYIMSDDHSLKTINLIYKNGVKVYDGSNEIEGASVITSNDDKVRYAEVYIPESFIGMGSFFVTSQDNYYVLYEEVTGQDKGIIWSSAIEDADSYKASTSYQPEKPEGYEYITAKAPDKQYDAVGAGTYSGIEIDGYFDDWNAVAGQTTNFSNADLDTKIVWDGDKVYGYIAIYGSEATESMISGQSFYLQTDGGAIREFSFKQASSSTAYYSGRVTISGISGAEVEMDSETKSSGWWIFGSKTYYYYYEFSIPTSAVGSSAQSVRMGIKSDSYDITLTDYTANLSPTSGDDDNGDINAGDDIDIDGVFDDWSNFPCTYIYYCDENHNNCKKGYEDYSHNGKTSGAAYIKDDKIVAHIKCTSKMTGNLVLTPYLTAVKVKVNENYEIDLVATQKSSSGSYRVMLVHEDGNSTPLGEMVIYDDGKALYEYEYYIDIEALAERLNLGPTELRTIELYYPYIGYQAIKVAGTSTAPYVGIAICFAVVGLTWFIRYMKDRRTV